MCLEKWKDMMNTAPSQLALLLLFVGLVTAKISGALGNSYIERTAYLLAIVDLVWLVVWGVYFFVTKREVKVLSVKYRFFVETFCNLLFLSYTYMIDGHVSIFIFSPLIIFIEWNIIKEVKENSNI